MSRRRKATDEQLLESYKRTGAVKATGAEFGMCGQSVHERLTKLSAMNSRNTFPVESDRLLIEYYEAYAAAGKLDDLARIMARTKPFLARQAKRLGLTKKDRPKPYLAPAMSARAKEWHRNNEHPRGMLGKTHTDEYKSRLSQESFAKWHGMTKDEQIAFVSKSHEKWKSGWREIAGRRIYFRSAWEFNYALYLEWLKKNGKIQEWDHEPITFWFLKIKRGTRSYLPDFRVRELDGSVVFHEVKGWMDPKSITKLKRMKKYYPEVALVLIDRKIYKSIERIMKPLLMGWE